MMQNFNISLVREAFIMKKFGAIVSSVLLAVLLFTAENSHALYIHGSLWDPADSAAENPSVMPVGDPTATFTVNDLNFDSRIGTVTFDTWLRGSNTSNPNGLVWLTDPLNVKDSFYTLAGGGSFMQFTGIAYFSANVAITHDDGFWLQLGNTVYDYSTPTVPATTYLHNAAGVYEFTLNYGAWNDMPEVLKVAGVAPVPEPGTVAMFGFGMFVLAIYGKRRMNKES